MHCYYERESTNELCISNSVFKFIKAICRIILLKAEQLISCCVISFGEINLIL